MSPTATEEHIPHHVEERIALSGDLDSKVRLADLGQRVVPDANLLDVDRIVLAEFLEQSGPASLNGEKEQADEVE